LSRLSWWGSVDRLQCIEQGAGLLDTGGDALRTDIVDAVVIPVLADLGGADRRVLHPLPQCQLGECSELGIVVLLDLDVWRRPGRRGAGLTATQDSNKGSGKDGGAHGGSDWQTVAAA